MHLAAKQNRLKLKVGGREEKKGGGNALMMMNVNVNDLLQLLHKQMGGK